MTNTTRINLARNRHMINGLVDVLINDTVYNNNLAIDNLNYVRCFLLLLLNINQRLSQLHNGLMKLESNVSTIYKYINNLSNKIVTPTLIDSVK